MGYFVPAAEHMRNDTGLPISLATVNPRHAAQRSRRSPSRPPR